MTYLWDWRTGHQALRLRGHSMGVAGVAFDPSGSTLVTAGEDGEVRLWSSTNGAIEVVTP